MGYMAKWGPRGFVCTTYKVLPIVSFSTTKAAKTENQSDTSGSGQTNIKGTEPYTTSLATQCLRAAGVDPRKQVEDWESLVGEAYPLYIGEERFGPEYMYLKSVSASNYMFTNSGKILSVDLQLEFEEFIGPVSTTAKKSGNSGSGTKAEAMSATASSADKNQKNTLKGRSDQLI